MDSGSAFELPLSIQKGWSEERNNFCEALNVYCLRVSLKVNKCYTWENRVTHFLCFLLLDY